MKEKKNLENMGILFITAKKVYPYFSIHAFKGIILNRESVKGKINYITINNAKEFNLTEEEKQLIRLLFRLQSEVILAKTSLNPMQFIRYGSSLIWEDFGHKLNAEARTRIDRDTVSICKHIFSKKLEQFPLFIVPQSSFTRPSMWKPVKLGGEGDIQFSIEISGGRIALQANMNTKDGLVNMKRDYFTNPFLAMRENRLYLNTNPPSAEIVKKIEAEKLEVDVKYATEIIDKIYIPWSNKFNFKLSDSFKISNLPLPIRFVIHLSEVADFLIIKPLVHYQSREVNTMIWQERDYYIQDEVFYYFRRNLSEENKLKALIEQSHKTIVQKHQSYYYVKKGDLLTDNWYFRFFNEMKEAGIPIEGLENLKTFRINPHQAILNWNVSSGIDWFEIDTQITFGNQNVKLKDLKKMLEKGEDNHFQLEDGSIGIIPQQWIDQIKAIKRMGREEKGMIRLSKNQLALLEEVQEYIDDRSILDELNAKKQALMAIAELPDIPLPASINATLRPYQNEGFQWMHKLVSTGWGGILADDMGLGKTLQALTIIVYLKEQNPNLKVLVICPTSLIYNWEKEINKYTAGITYKLHYGTSRSKKNSDIFILDANLLITSYGTLRSDIDLLKKINFDYIILDESHAIKNTAAQVTQAVNKLQAKNRLCLSGTPLQNNTFDLYAQMNFINPGLLGNPEFFRDEYANPIDRNGDEKQREKLKRIIYPFMLRRTKEQVAGDLPEKTEIIFYCEMAEEQRTIYEAYRNEISGKLKAEIETEGLAKSQMSVITALTKLRQICNSPALLPGEQYPDHSIKSEELLRELEENLGQHKALVFSQFTSMLALLEKRLQAENISYCYLDGSTSAEKRMAEVDRFQKSDDLRVFLISLKAGGVGLNLTAADYVFLIDPWWNPAVESQAIDRTHRIGQTKNVLAYKFICKDTVEEKILKLQSRKKALSEDIIGTEHGFVKRLSAEDISYLFS